MALNFFSFSGHEFNSPHINHDQFSRQKYKSFSQKQWRLSARKESHGNWKKITPPRPSQNRRKKKKRLNNPELRAVALCRKSSRLCHVMAKQVSPNKSNGQAAVTDDVIYNHGNTTANNFQTTKFISL